MYTPKPAGRNFPNNTADVNEKPGDQQMLDLIRFLDLEVSFDYSLINVV